MLERRRYPRVPEESGIAVKLIPSGPEAADRKSGTFLRLTRDISVGGLRFVNSEEIPQNAALKIHFNLGLPRKIITHVGRVRWTRRVTPDEPFSVGVEFTETPSIDMKVWTHYLETRLQPGEPG